MIKYRFMKKSFRTFLTILFSSLLLILSVSLAAGAFKLLMSTVPVASVSELHVSDYDGDSLGEVIASGPDRRIYLYENDGTFVYSTNQLGGTVFRKLISVAPQLGDREGGILITDTQRAFFNVAAKSPVPLWTNTVAAGWVFLQHADTGDFNGDGLYDVANARYRAATNVFRLHVIRAVNGTQIVETGNLAGNLDSLILENLGRTIYDSLVFSSNAPRFYIYSYNPATGGLVQNASVALPQRYGFLGVVTDVNGDGVRDVCCATLISAGNNGLDIRSGLNGALLSQLRVSGAAVPVSMAVADLDGDGVFEVAIGTGGTDSRLRIYKARNPITLVYQSPVFTGSVFVRAGDLDGDGNADLGVAEGSNIRFIKFDTETKQYVMSETSQAISGSINLFEKFKTARFSGSPADDVVWANNLSSELKAATFYSPPKRTISVSNEKVINVEISGGQNYLLDKISYTSNADGVLNSVRFSYSGNLNPQYITGLKLFKDDGDGRFEPGKDQLLGQTTVSSGQAVFNVDAPFTAGAKNLVYLAADIRDDVASGFRFKFLIESPQDFYAQNFETTGSFPLETSEFITVDRTIPVIFVQPSKPSPDGNEGWYRSALYISLTMNKLGLIYYKWNDDAAFRIYNGQLTPPLGESTLTCYAVDLYGNVSTTKTVNFKVDLTPPEKVRGLQAEQTSVSRITLVWRPSLDKKPGSGLKAYEIHRNGRLIATVSSNQTSYEDFDIKPLTEYRYRVRAVDTAGNKGLFSEEFAVKTGPAPLEIKNIKVIEGELSNTIIWEPVEDPSAAFMEVLRSQPDRARGFSKISTVPVEPDSGIFVDQLDSGDTGRLFYYRLKLYDAEGNVLFESAPVASSMVNIERKVDSSGGTLKSASHRFSLEIPAGSLLGEPTVTVKSTVQSPPSGSLALSEIYELGPEGLTFSIPATLTISFRSNNKLNPDLVRIGYHDGTRWNLFKPDFLDLRSGKASIRIDHFSLFGVFYLSSEVDIEPPYIRHAKGASPSKVFVRFNEFVDSQSVHSAFVEISETSVTTFYPLKDGQTMVIETKYMKPDREYFLYLSGVKDLAGNLIEENGTSNTANFTVTPSPHGKYLDDTAKCTLCHSVHYGRNSRLLLKENATEVCYLCHDTGGSGSKYATQSWFEDPDAVSFHRTRPGDDGIYCTDCHSPHRDPSLNPSLLRVRNQESTQTTQPPEQFCFDCHGESVTTLPAHLRIKESSYTAGIHFESLPGPSSGNGITCMHCHEPHASVLPTLMRGGTEEYVCIICHKKEGVSPESGARIDAPDVLSSLLSAPDATSGLPGFPPDKVVWYRHPVIEYSGRHSLLEMFDATLSAQSQASPEFRHAECEDCHNSHYAKQTIFRNPPFIPDSLIGAAGVKVLYPYETTVPVFVFEPYGGNISYEYEVCLRCHSSFVSGWQGDDLARLFSPYNGSYHPVISIGKNQTDALRRSLIGLTPSSLILCSDCHYSSDPTYPRGPHGSIYPFILSGKYLFEIKPQSTSDDYQRSDFELCYKCHSAEPFEDSSGSSRPDTNFRYHGYHLRSIYNNPGANTIDGGILTPGAGKGNAICRECHYSVHGSENPRLVKFSPNVLPSGSNEKPVFVPKSENSDGYCLLKCHGVEHGTDKQY